MRTILRIIVYGAIAFVLLEFINVVISPRVISHLCASNYIRDVITRATLEVPVIDAICAKHAPALNITSHGFWRLGELSRAYSAYSTSIIFLVMSCIMIFNGIISTSLALLPNSVRMFAALRGFRCRYAIAYLVYVLSPGSPMITMPLAFAISEIALYVTDRTRDFIAARANRPPIIHVPREYRRAG